MAAARSLILATMTASMISGLAACPTWVREAAAEDLAGLMDELRTALPSGMSLSYDQATGDPVAGTAVITGLELERPSGVLNIEELRLTGLERDGGGAIEHFDRLELDSIELRLAPAGKLTLHDLSMAQVDVAELRALLSGAERSQAMGDLDLGPIRGRGAALAFEGGWATFDSLSISEVVGGRIDRLGLEKVLVAVDDDDARMTLDELSWSGISLLGVLEQVTEFDAAGRSGGLDLRALNQASAAMLPTSFALAGLEIEVEGATFSVEEALGDSFLDEQGRVAYQGRVGPMVIPASIAAAGIAEEMTGGMPGLDGRDVTISITGEGTYDLDTLDSASSMQFDSEQLGSLELSFAGRALELADPTMAKMAAGSADLPSPTLSRLHLDYRDRGLVEEMTNRIAETMGVDRETFAVQMITFARIPFAQTMTPRLENMFRAAQDFLTSPGRLTISLTPPEPVPVDEMLSSGMVDPAALGDRLELEVRASP